MRQRRRAIGADDHAFTRRQTVILHHVRRAELVECGRDVVQGQAEPGGAGRHAGRGHHLFGEGFAAFQFRRLGRRTEAGGSSGPDGVRHPGDERHLGSNHHQIDAELGSQLRDLSWVVGRHRMTLSECRDSRIPRRRVQFGDGRIGVERADQGVFAGTGPDDKKLHNPRA
jgi:hypothetical protein